MLNIIFYFQVHQPYRLNHLNVMNIDKPENFFDEELNREVMQRIAEKCYLPANRILLKLIRKYNGAFRVAFSITGTAIEQFIKYAPEVLDSFRQLVDTGSVELITETYYHSLAYLYDTDEFLDQIHMHEELMLKHFGMKPTVFRNTELIYQDMLSTIVFEEGYETILAEGAERVLQWRSPLYAYKNYSRDMTLLLRYYKLSDDIAFRFSDTNWKEYPLTPAKFVNWINKLTLSEKEDKNLFLNLFMDYETFGEHQWPESGILEFLEKMPQIAIEQPNIHFCWPSEAYKNANYQQENILFPESVS
ncbi:MAG: glycoside hydrolase family 57 protein, partial [Candidatus Cloacimonetes bacterium]|nr:glycoside hydrolase family 57 protein [Candidatus Cloacimonadota bacterium]